MALEQLISQAEKLASAHFDEIKVQGRGRNTSLKHSLYDETVDLYNEIATHYVWGADASELIQKARPYEPEAIQEYREEAYEQETFPHGQRILGLIKGALSHPQLFSIDFPPAPVGADDKGIRIEDYVYTGMPGAIKNLNTYFWEFIFLMSMVDPNGWVAVLQKTPDFELVDNPDQFRDPYPEYIPSSHILDYGNDYCLVQSTEMVVYKDKKAANCFWFFTPDITFKCVPTGEKRDGKVQYEALIWHEHFFNELQIRQVGGMLSGVKNSVLEDNPQSFHLSHLQPTIPAFNKAVRYLSDLDAFFVMHMHPIKVEEMLACEDCVGGIIEGGASCGTCGGSGKVSPGNSVFSGYSKDIGDDGKLESPILYVSPDSAIFKEARDYIGEKLMQAYEGVNAAFLVKKTGGQNEAARSRELNREPLLLYFRQVAATVFPLYQWVLDMVNRIRYEPVLGSGYEENRPVIIEPANYDTSILDLVIDELVKIKQTDMPASVVSRFMQNAITKRFGAESKEAKIMNTYLQVDIYAAFTEDDMLILSATQTADPVREYIHVNVIDLVSKCLEEDDEFLEQTEANKREIVYNKAKAEMPEKIVVPIDPINPLEKVA